MDDEFEIVDDPETGAPADAKDKIRALKEKIAALDKEKQEYLEGWQRAKAELVNFRRDEERRLELWKNRLENEMILDFLSVLDSFDLALNPANRAHLGADAEKGLTLIRSQFLDVLRRLNIEPIDTRNASFDPQLHEAIGEVNETGSPPGRVAEELQKGYRRNGIVLRPAKVKIST